MENPQMENPEYAKLLDYYAPLLTNNQREIAKLYFSFDLTLSEIAEEKGVSRQSVFESVAKIKRQLDEWEESLGFFAERKKREEKLNSILRFAEKLPEKEGQELKELVYGVI